MNLYKIIFIFASCFQNSQSLQLNLNNEISRRNVFTSNTAIISSKMFNNLSPTFNNAKNNSENDPYAHWSFFGLAPPPIEKDIKYNELLDLIKNYEIYTIQIAPQHNCVIATTKENHRLACYIKDKDFDKLLYDSLTCDNLLPFYVLPIDPIRSKVRNIAQSIFGTFSLFYLATEFDYIDFDMTPYGSIEERINATIENKPRKKYLKEFLNNIFNNTKKI